MGLTGVATREIRKGEEFVLIPRRTYERFLRSLPPKKGKRLSVHDRLGEALRDVREGRVFGPFETIEDLRASLEK